jgi:hypothetical protein
VRGSVSPVPEGRFLPPQQLGSWTRSSLGLAGEIVGMGVRACEGALVVKCDSGQCMAMLVTEQRLPNEAGQASGRPRCSACVLQRKHSEASMYRCYLDWV